MGALLTFTLSAQVIHSNQFDDVPVGSKVAASYPTWWTPFLNKPSEDPVISNEQSSSAPQSVKLSWGHDLVFKAGDQTSGIYIVEFDMYIPNNAPAYFNLLHVYSTGNQGQDSKWAVGVYMNITNPSGFPKAGTYIQQNDVLTDFVAVSNQWFPVKFLVDLDKDTARLWINGQEYLKNWIFSTPEQTGHVGMQLAAVDFYPPHSGSTFYIDNFVFGKWQAPPPPAPIMNVAPLEFSATIKEDAEVLVAKNTVTISNTGTADGTYTITVEAEKPWLTIDGDATGTVAIAGTKTFDVVMDATGLDTIVHTGIITVATDDVNNPVFEINCTLTVEAKEVGIITINGVETKIFPNPASNFVTVQCSEMINSIQIMNNMGQVVRTVSVNSDVTHLDTSNLSAGVYFVKVITDKTAFSNKLIIK